jgi:hypothetical protein
LRQRTWARGTTITYTTNAAGEVNHIAYSDSTGGVTNIVLIGVTPLLQMGTQGHGSTCTDSKLLANYT